MISDSTPYADVNKILSALLSEVQNTLADQMVGLYLYGSLSSGDFNTHSSDIDFLVVTADALSQDSVVALRAMHSKLWASDLKLAAKLEGAYVPKHILRRYDRTADPCPTVNEKAFYLDRQAVDWIIQRYVIREQGMVLSGPPAHTLIDPVGPDDLRYAVRGILHEWWQPMVADPTNLRREGHQPFAILTMCRALYTLEYGRIVSKPASARWAMNRLEVRWKALIERGLLAWEDAAPLDDLNEVQAFIAHVIAQS